MQIWMTFYSGGKNQSCSEWPKTHFGLGIFEILYVVKQGSNLLQCILVQIILNLDDFLFWWDNFLLIEEKK